jgi:hypothetical protein
MCLPTVPKSFFLLSRKSSVTAEGLESYKDLIKNATDDLEAHLQSIDEKLEIIFARNMDELDSAEVRHIREERLSTQKCLQICAQLSEHINQIQFRPTELEGLPQRVTSEGIQQCRDNLGDTAAKLERHLETLFDRLMAKSRIAMTQEEFSDLKRLQEEWKTARQCIDICSKADYHLRENISVIDNHASGDETVQFLVSTNEKTIHGKNRGYGLRIRQVGGHLSDESLQQLSRDITRISLHNASIEGVSIQGDLLSETNDAVERESTSGLREQSGRGMTVNSRPNPEVTKISESLGEQKPKSSRKRSDEGS